MKLQYILFVFFLIFLSSCSKDESQLGNDSDELFGNWSPSFTNQIDDFTQTRVGNKGSEQTRLITVSQSEMTYPTLEERINKDINSDDDLFDEVNEITKTFTASENLGSFQITLYEIIKDNDMVFRVGNQTFEISNGFFYTWGMAKDGWGDDGCTSYEGYGNEFQLWGPEAYLDNNGNITGNGLEIYFDLITPIPNELTEGEYEMIWVREWYNTNTGDCIQPHKYSGFSSRYGDYQLHRENSTSGNDYIKIKSGIINLTITNSKYIMQFDGLDEINNPISFYFNGLLSKIADYTGKVPVKDLKRLKSK